MTGRQMLRVFLGSFPGKAGVGLLFILVVLSIFAVLHFPLDWGETTWSNPAKWADNPKAAPPAWVNIFPGIDRARHAKLSATRPAQVEPSGTGEVRTYRLPYELKSSDPPTFTSFSLSDVTFHSRPPLLTVSMERPDGSELLLYRQVVRGPREDEEAPYRRFHEEPMRVLLTSEAEVVSAVGDFYRDRYGFDVPQATLRSSMNRALFGVPDPQGPDPVRLVQGKYAFIVRAQVADPRDSVGPVRFVIGGSAFGFMGTDAQGRDLAQGLLFGLPVALVIGIAASVITTAIGASLGVISGYAGGVTDMLIQRFSDIVNNVPLLPLLIFFVFVVGSNLWLIILFLVAFSWPGLTILIRSMVLQLRSGQLVEAAVTVGASRWRIMYRHIFPQVAPYVFAQMIFFAPAAILAEAGLSFLGLGDPSIPTWGQILESGFQTGGVYLGYWWWVVPPGLLIIITAVTFMFISLGMEPVVNPRLRQVR